MLLAQRRLRLGALPVVLRAATAAVRRLWQLLVQRAHLQVLRIRPVPAPLLALQVTLQVRCGYILVRFSTLPGNKDLPYKPQNAH